MKRLIALCLPLALMACGGVTGAINSLPPSPSAIADSTVLDEQGALAAELAYKAARVAVETGVDAGLIRSATAAKVAKLDQRAFTALGVVRKAYAAGIKFVDPDAQMGGAQAIMTAARHDAHAPNVLARICDLDSAEAELAQFRRELGLY